MLYGRPFCDLLLIRLLPETPYVNPFGSCLKKEDYCGGYPLANHKSAAKRARQSIRKTAVNNARKSTVKTVEKSLVKAIQAKDLKALPELLKKFTSSVMKAAKTGVIKKETASRKISRLSTRVSAAK